MQIRTYGKTGRTVVVLHGGPGAPGYMGPVARRLGESFRALEPWQRGSGAEPLTVARHVRDLHELVSRCEDQPAVVGHSWGAMLALAYAAAHPGCVASLVLIGCGTFDPAARSRLQAIREERTDEALRRRLEDLREETPDPDERLRALGNLLLPVYSWEPTVRELDVVACDARAGQETWSDMMRLQASGVYPAAFASIVAPVLMLHGAVDPHPGRMIRESLRPHLRRLEYHEWERCGHYPWLEAAAGEAFFSVMVSWLTRRFRVDPDRV